MHNNIHPIKKTCCEDVVHLLLESICKKANFFVTPPYPDRTYLIQEVYSSQQKNCLLAKRVTKKNFRSKISEKNVKNSKGLEQAFLNSAGLTSFL